MSTCQCHMQKNNYSHEIDLQFLNAVYHEDLHTWFNPILGIVHDHSSDPQSHQFYSRNCAAMSQLHHCLMGASNHTINHECSNDHLPKVKQTYHQHALPILSCRVTCYGTIKCVLSISSSSSCESWRESRHVIILVMEAICLIR